MVRVLWLCKPSLSSFITVSTGVDLNSPGSMVSSYRQEDVLIKRPQNLLLLCINTLLSNSLQNQLQFCMLRTSSFLELLSLMGRQGEGRARGGNKWGKAVLSYLLCFSDDCLFLWRKYGPECWFDFCGIPLLLLGVASCLDRGGLKFFSVHQRS